MRHFILVGFTFHKSPRLLVLLLLLRSSPTSLIPKQVLFIHPRTNRLRQLSKAVKVKAELARPLGHLASFACILLGHHCKYKDRGNLSNVRVEQDRSRKCLDQLQDLVKVV